MQDDSDDEEGRDKVGSLFQKAKAIGAKQGTSDDLPTQGAFGGQGRTLAGSSAQVCWCMANSKPWILLHPTKHA